MDGRVMEWGDSGAKKTEKGTVDHALSEFWVVGLRTA